MAERKPVIYLVSQGKENDVPPYDEPPPFGLLYVGQALKDAGYRVRVIHLHGRKDQSLEKAVSEEIPLFVGFSNFICPTLQYDIELSRRLRAQGIPVVWGGIFTTCMPEATLSSDAVAHLVAACTC